MIQLGTPTGRPVSVTCETGKYVRIAGIESSRRIDQARHPSFHDERAIWRDEFGRALFLGAMPFYWAKRRWEPA